MSDFLDFLLEFLRSLGLKEANLHLAEIIIPAAGLVFSMGILGYMISWFQFRKRSFFDQMTIGINMIERAEDGSHILKLRTLIEGNLDVLLDNPILQNLVQKAAKECTETNPVLRLKNTEDHALLITKLQNVISSIFAKEYMLKMLGYTFESRWVDFVVTCERYGGLKSTKIRVLVFTRKEIEQLDEPEFLKKVVIEVPHHKDRLHTLRLVVAEMRQEKNSAHGQIEILMNKS